MSMTVLCGGWAGHAPLLHGTMELRRTLNPLTVMTASTPTSPAPVAQRSRLSLYLDLIRFDRPAGWLVLVWPTLVALWVASNGFPGWHLLIVFVLGTVLMRSAG